MRLIKSFSLLLLVSLAAAAQAQTYRWVDKDGRVHYTGTPPPPSALSGEQKRLGGNLASGGDLPYATQEAMKKYPVRLYASPNCEPCDQGRALLGKRGIPFQETTIFDNEAGRAEMKRLGVTEGLPILAVGKDIRPGFAAEAWNSALDSAGYAKSAAAKPQSAPAPTAPVPAPSTAAPKEESLKKDGYSAL